ncbi:33 kDa chaperonin [Methylocystis bryophila]|uniref:Hsp33 family molecular chaperone n=1 Tax=Methylocystis bryophila TaxID=655015 RepID=A0A1W6MVW4_9HYPH|nr:Hsp33 family molecular chaperone [Methylocystis bryophila]BDV37813.1 33 kDa chaperonin [Methylocystis bryophila]
MKGAPASRPVSNEPEDDSVLAFAVPGLDLRGRIVRLGPVVDEILTNYPYPESVARALGEGVALTALLGSMMTRHDRFQLQTRSDGAIDLLVVDYDPPGRLRGFARYEKEGEAPLGAPAELLGRGHMALTIENPEEDARHQGVVALEGEGLALAAFEYFRQSEQIPSFLRLAVAEVVEPRGRRWRAGGILLQFLPPRGASLIESTGEVPDSWNEGVALATTIADHELVDPSLSAERLLYRLFHERGVTVETARPLKAGCRCTDERVENMLKSFSSQDRADMVGDDGRIVVTCEFCNRRRIYDPAALD